MNIFLSLLFCFVLLGLDLYVDRLVLLSCCLLVVYPPVPTHSGCLVGS